MSPECDPTNIGIDIGPEKPTVQKDLEPESDGVEFVWTIDGPRPIIQRCWGLKQLTKDSDC